MRGCVLCYVMSLSCQPVQQQQGQGPGRACVGIELGCLVVEPLIKVVDIEKGC